MAQLELTGIGRVALKVADIERSLAFYRDRLGFREIMRLNHDTGELWLVYLRITDTQFLELFPDGEGNEAPDSLCSELLSLRGAPDPDHFLPLRDRDSCIYDSQWRSG